MGEAGTTYVDERDPSTCCWLEGVMVRGAGMASRGYGVDMSHAVGLMYLTVARGAGLSKARKARDYTDMESRK